MPYRICVISVLISTVLNNQTYVGLEFLNILRGEKCLFSTFFSKRLNLLKPTCHVTHQRV
jgi:hypothetical protein